MNDPILPLDLMRRLRQQLSRRLLPQNEFLPVVRGQLVCGVRLAETELEENGLDGVWGGGMVGVGDLLDADGELDGGDGGR